MSKKWDFFLAYASGDKHQAEALHKLLNTKSEIFLDSQTLSPGDDWSQALSDAQKDSLITIVLISSKTDKAYYQREEIATAIEMAREDLHTHRVVPVYLDGQVNNKPPYGLRSLQAINVSELGSLDGVANRLLGLLEDVRKNSAIGENKKIDGNSGSRKAPRLLNRKYILSVFIIVVIILALSVWAYFGHEPRPKAELTECYDNIDKEVDKTDFIKYVTKAKGWPFEIRATDAGWEVDKNTNPNHRLIEGDKIGLIKCDTNKIYSYYGNFIFEFQVRPKQEGIAWVVRAENFGDYYLFKLGLPKNFKEGILLEAYAYKDNERLKSIYTPTRLYIDYKPLEPVRIKMIAIDSDFYLCISTYPFFPSEKTSASVHIKDKDRTFSLGGIGFASLPGFEVLLAELHITPYAHITENPCQ